MSSSRNKTANWNCVCGTVERQREQKGMSAGRQKERGRRRGRGQRGVYWELSHMCVSDRTHCALITRDKVDKL